MTAIQRFGSALNLNVHFHTLAVQGVFVDDPKDGLRFVPNPEPTDGEVAELLVSISEDSRDKQGRLTPYPTRTRANEEPVVSQGDRSSASRGAKAGDRPARNRTRKVV